MHLGQPLQNLYKLLANPFCTGPVVLTRDVTSLQGLSASPALVHTAL